MFPKFEAAFRRDISGPTGDSKPIRSSDAQLTELLTRFGGASFNQGQYRVIDVHTFALARTFVKEAFPDSARRGTPFAYDWLGRVFALDTARKEDGHFGVLMLEPGTGEALEIPANLITFHERDLIESGDAVLASSFHQNWIESGGAAPGLRQCIGYKVPLFLNGVDDATNLELSDLDVYWSISAQLLGRVGGR